MAWYHIILAILFAFLAIILMGVILLQRGKGVGLSGAFGGAGGHTAFGAKTGDVLTWATIVIAVALLTFAVILNYIFVPPTPFGAPASVTAPLGAPPVAAPGPVTPPPTDADGSPLSPVEPGVSPETEPPAAPLTPAAPAQREEPLEPGAEDGEPGSEPQETPEGP